MNRAVYPGTFDPVTNGHFDLIRRGARMFEELIVAVASGASKNPLFSVSERVDMIKLVVEDAGISNVKVDSFNGMTVDYVESQGMKVILRGIRSVADFENELQMASTNRKLDDKIETVFFMSSEQYFFLSSRLIKEIASLGGDLSAFVHPKVEDRLKEKLRK